APTQTVYSQGDTAQGSYIARKKYKSDGKGVKLGILSDSYNNHWGAETGVMNGELPGPKNPYGYKKPVKVLSDMEAGGIDEGRAMAEIVHDVAPGAEIAFHTADFGQAAFAQGILELANIGCQVIVDDIFYLDEPYFQDGIIAQAIDKVVKKGVTYFTAAGNSSNNSYEMNYKPSGFEPMGPGWGTAHNFAAPGATPIYQQPIFIPSGGRFTVGLQWDDPFYSVGGSGAETDLDLLIFDNLGNLRYASMYSNIGSDPFELIGFFNNTPNTTFFVSILKYEGPNPSRVKYVMFDEGSFYYNVPVPGQFAPSIVGHSNSAGAISTAAAFYKATPAYGQQVPLIEGFSSLGGTMIYFDNEGIRIPAILRKKPDITAPDGGNTSFFFRDDADDTDASPNFYGTSAAAPHAAAAAALMIDAQKLNTLTPSQIRGIMATKTYDMDNRYAAGFEKGFDYNTGTGLIRAEQSVGEVKFPNLYIKNLELVSLCSDDPAKTRNWKVVNPNPFEVKAHWFLTGFGQDNKSYLPPGDTYFTTQTGYYRNKVVPNIVILDWEDNFGFTRFDLASATANECKNDQAATQVLSAGDKVALVKEKPVKPEIADVFPNPSHSQFKLYLSLNTPGKADITLFTESGKLLYRNNVPGSGIYDIDASNYKPGLYLMKIQQGSFTRTIKVIKQ
ncbi:MAG: T9SS type A sorting domain-containing protein, partial [Chitinophagaceae bacterium]